MTLVIVTDQCFSHIGSTLVARPGRLTPIQVCWWSCTSRSLTQDSTPVNGIVGYQQLNVKASEGVNPAPFLNVKDLAALSSFANIMS